MHPTNEPTNVENPEGRAVRYETTIFRGTYGQFRGNFSRAIETVIWYLSESRQPPGRRTKATAEPFSARYADISILFECT